jgi:mannose/fructose/N-acetylgalactosamine-specific phosphotransferase system component IIC
MFHLFGFIFIILISVLVIGLSIVGNILRLLFGFGRKSSANTTKAGPGSAYRYQSTEKREQENMRAQSDADAKHKKIFGEDEGEYIDYEEVK